MFLVAALLFLLSRVRSAGPDDPEFKLVYGHVLAQKLSFTHSTSSPADVTEVLQIAQKVVQAKTGASAQVQDFSKSRLYFTANGATPYVLEDSLILSGQVFVQRMHISLGFLYTVSLNATETRSSVYHRLTITRDLNNDYHVFSHTFSVCPPPHSRLHSDLSEPRVDEQIFAGANLFLEEGRCSGPCRHGDTQCSVSMDEEGAGEETTSNTFHCSKETERQPLHGDECLQNDECSLTKESRCRFNCTRCCRGLLPGGHSVRVATYNMWNLNSFEWESYSERLARLGKMLRAQEPDILAVQEVRFEAGDHTHNQIGELAGFLPDHQYVFQPAMIYMERIDVRTEEGVAILSRHPILNSDYIILHRNESDEVDSHQRVCLHAEVLSPSLGRVHVFVTHLSLSAASQETSVVELWKYMSRFTGYKLLMGDFNAEPDSPALRFLRGELAMGGVVTEGLWDTWLEAGHKSDCNGLTFSTLTHLPTKRIDYILHQSHSSQVRVTRASIMEEGEYCVPPCSDHHGVMATITCQP